MAADFVWSESNLVGQVVEDDIDNLNFGSVDDHDLVPATYPIIAGANSYQKYFRAKFTGSFTEISNILFWRSDVLGYKTGETCKGLNNVAYATPINTIPDPDNEVAVPLSLGTAWAIQAADGSATITPPEDYSKYIRLQLRTTGSTPAGSVFQKTYTLQYDEI